MILVDTSVWVDILRDKTGKVVSRFRHLTQDELIVLSRFNQLELLQGAKNEGEWKMLADYLSTQLFLEATKQTWPEAARIFFELRKQGMTVRSPIDCCIAQCALENEALLLHKDKDFEIISKVRDLKQQRFS